MTESLLKSIGIIALLAITGRNANAQVATIWFVDGGYTGVEAGMSWGSPFNTIDEAIAAADEDAGVPRDQIWVKFGEYTRGVTATGIVLKPRVHFYGGFAGTEASTPISDTYDPRQFDADGYLVYETILSGELGDPDDFSDNVKLLVTAPTAVDGYVRRGGAAR